MNARNPLKPQSCVARLFIMNEQDAKKDEPRKEVEESNPGFFKRIFAKIDESIKEKADAKSDDDCCGGGKCC